MTSRDPVADLAASNLFYRQPELYDQVQADPRHTAARTVEQLVRQHAPTARTLLDFGCGTGRDLEHLADHFDCVGVDLQPQMVTYAQQTRPHLDVRTGDIRDFRLGRTMDVITCLGNSLAYVHEDDDLAAAFTTFAAHARTGTLLVLATLAEPVVTEPRTHRVETADLHGEVTISYVWDEPTRINTMRRAWRLDDGAQAQDCVHRRVLTREEIRGYLGESGFALQPRLVDLGGYVVGTYFGACDEPSGLT